MESLLSGSNDTSHQGYGDEWGSLYPSVPNKVEQSVENITMLWAKGYVQGLFKKHWEPQERSSHKFS